MITLIVHGGAGRIDEEDRAAYQQGLSAALEEGFSRLSAGASALEAVIASVCVMEDNPAAFNAGTGGSPNRDGIVECDAAVMAGWDRSAGAVAALTCAKNPVLVAERVRRESPHVLLVGQGAAAYVDTPIDNRLLLTERSQRRLAAWRAKQSEPQGTATVGAVALDRDGRLAAATSTGGVLGKLPGRVGDTPLIGAGTYADASVAISCTGKGEAFIRAVTAKALACALASGSDPSQALRSALDEVAALDGSGGLICLTRTGQIMIGFNTPQMAFGWQRPAGLWAEVGLTPGITLR